MIFYAGSTRVNSIGTWRRRWTNSPTSNCCMLAGGSPNGTLPGRRANGRNARRGSMNRGIIWIDAESPVD